MSQNDKILTHLRKAKSKGITPIEALADYGCFRLAARIRDLRDDGHNIITKTVERRNKKFAKYVLIKEA
jgi:hypothetical protein